MITKAERQELDAAAKAYEAGLRRFYKGHPCEDRIADYVARYRAAYRLRLEHKKQGAQAGKENNDGGSFHSCGW